MQMRSRATPDNANITTAATVNMIITVVFAAREDILTDVNS